jgi:hypothetical protein
LRGAVRIERHFDFSASADFRQSPGASDIPDNDDGAAEDDIMAARRATMSPAARASGPSAGRRFLSTT